MMSRKRPVPLSCAIRRRVGDADAVGRLVVGGPDRPQLVEVVRRGHPLDAPLEHRQVERRGDLDGTDLPRLPGELAVVPAELRPVVLQDRRLALPVVVPVVGVEVAVEVDDVGRVVQPLGVRSCRYGTSIG
jgi:hypothetical protein